MSRGANQKFKIYRLAQIMLERTDEEHYLTMPEIIAALKEYDIPADRKSLYADLKDLEILGIEVEGAQIGHRYRYHVLNHPFELPELKLLVDAIQSSKFYYRRENECTDQKLEKLVSKYDAMKLQRQVYVSGRIKTMNESIYYTVDAIHNAIAQNKKIRFQYFQWNVKKEMELRHGGAYYHISPWGLSWDDENYYLVAFDGNSGIIKHYRVDKMRKIEILDEARDGREEFEEFDAAKYAKKVFGMFTGDEQRVKIQFDNKLIGVVIDRFGQDIMIIPKGVDQFVVNVNVKVSNMFLGWIIGLGDGAKILEPESVVDEVKQITERLKEQYK